MASSKHHNAGFMVSRMRRRWGRFRAGSDPEIVVRNSNGKPKLSKQSSSLRHIPATQKTNDVRKRSDSQEKSERSDKIKTAEKKTATPVRPSISVEKGSQQREAPPKPKKTVRMANDGRPVNLPPVTRRASRSDASVTSSRSVKKMLGMRSYRPPVKKVNSRRSHFDDKTYLTFNTLPERRLYQQQLAEKQRASRFDCIKDSADYVANTSAAIGASIVQDAQNLGNALSTCFQSCGESITSSVHVTMAAISGTMAALCATCTSAAVSEAPSYELDDRDTIDKYRVDHDENTNRSYTTTTNYSYANTKVSALTTSQASHHSPSSKRSDALETTKTPPTSNSTYCHSKTHHPPSVLNDKSESKASSAGGKTYDWENLDDESLVSRPKLLHPNKMQIGRKLIDYDDLTHAYHEAAHADLEDPGCSPDTWNRCFQWDENEFGEDDLTLDTYRTELTPLTQLQPKPRPTRHYDFDSPSTIQEGDETYATSFDNTFEGMYDARDEPSLADEGRVHWR